MAKPNEIDKWAVELKPEPKQLWMVAAGTEAKSLYMVAAFFKEFYEFKTDP